MAIICNDNIENLILKAFQLVLIYYSRRLNFLEVDILDSVFKFNIVIEINFINK